MSFTAFQTTTATMKKIETDGFGDESETLTFSVDIDPVLGKKRVFTRDQEEITGLSTVISPHDSIDLTHENWRLEYNGRDYQVEQMVPFCTIGTNTLEHIEVVLR